MEPDVPSPTSEALTGREAQIMDVIWRLGEATAEQVRGELPESLHDSTVRTLRHASPVILNLGIVAVRAKRGHSRIADQRPFLALAGTRIASMTAASAGDTWRRPG